MPDQRDWLIAFVLPQGIYEDDLANYGSKVSSIWRLRSGSPYRQTSAIFANGTIVPLILPRGILGNDLLLVLEATKG